MDAVAVGFWGAWFGIAALAFLAGFVPLVHGLARLSLLMSATPLLNVVYVAATLGWFPGGAAVNLRLQSAMALTDAVALSALMLLMVRTPRWVWRAWAGCAAAGLGILGLSLALPPASGMLLCVGFAIAWAFLAMALLVSPRALRSERLAWLAICSVATAALGLAGTAWLAARGAAATPWQAHASIALVVIAHQACIAAAIWSRFSHLAELQLVRAYGSGWDPVTRMLSLDSAGRMINKVFSERSDAVGVIVLNVANLYALENLHGRAEYNQALFVLASRVRSVVPAGAHTARLGRDEFLLLVRRPRSEDFLLLLAQRLRQRLARPITLGHGKQPSELRLGAHQWSAELAVGVVMAPAASHGAVAVNSARSMARTALTYASRIACERERRPVEVLPEPLAA